ncbi:MAG TPA: SIMPL domain-containing protein [Euzebyales bacterium]|nr:SIMPL domain-containing protein [Euzebyales bacterium]
MGDLLVRGHAEGRLQPTHAVFEVVVEARDPGAQEAALARAGELCAIVDAAVGRDRRGTDPLIRASETSSIRTAEQWEYAPGGHRRRVGWLAQRGTRIECAPDASGLTVLVGALAHDGIRVSGPEWHVAPHATGWDGLRTAAVADAVRRASAYAEGVGGRVGAVQWIAEPGLRRGPGAPDDTALPVMRQASLSMESGQPADEPLPVRVSVEPVEVGVTVEVAFDLD